MHIPQPLLDLVGYIPTKEYKRFRRTLKVVHRVSGELVREKRDALLADSKTNKDVLSILGKCIHVVLLEFGNALTSYIVRANVAERPEARLSDEELIAQMATLVFAGHITTSTTLTWMLYELARKQDYQDRMREEIAQARSRLGGGDFSMEDLEGMTYVTACLKVTFALSEDACKAGG